MNPLIILFVYLAVIIAVLLYVAIRIAPLLLFSKGMQRMRSLEERGSLREAYQVGQKLLKWTGFPIVRQTFSTDYTVALMLHLGRLAHSLGNADTATDWTEQVAKAILPRTTALWHCNSKQSGFAAKTVRKTRKTWKRKPSPLRKILLANPVKQGREKPCTLCF